MIIFFLAKLLLIRLFKTKLLTGICQIKENLYWKVLSFWGMSFLVNQRDFRLGCLLLYSFGRWDTQAQVPASINPDRTSQGSGLTPEL